MTAIRSVVTIRLRRSSDSMCCFNPIYGQGTTVATQQAVVLRSVIMRCGLRDPRLTSRFQRRAWKVAKPAWDLATGADHDLPTLRDAAPRTVRLTNAYVRRILRAATSDADIARRIVRIMHLLDPSTGLLYPRMIAAARGRYEAAVPAAATPVDATPVDATPVDATIPTK